MYTLFASSIEGGRSGMSRRGSASGENAVVALAVLVVESNPWRVCVRCPLAVAMECGGCDATILGVRRGHVDR